jgi:hypothetical protein
LCIDVHLLDCNCLVQDRGSICCCCYFCSCLCCCLCRCLGWCCLCCRLLFWKSIAWKCEHKAKNQREQTYPGILNECHIEGLGMQTSSVRCSRERSKRTMSLGPFGRSRRRKTFSDGAALFCTMGFDEAVHREQNHSIVASNCQACFPQGFGVSQECSLWGKCRGFLWCLTWRSNLSVYSFVLEIE